MELRRKITLIGIVKRCYKYLAVACLLNSPIFQKRCVDIQTVMFWLIICCFYVYSCYETAILCKFYRNWPFFTILSADGSFIIQTWLLYRSNLYNSDFGPFLAKIPIFWSEFVFFWFLRTTPFHSIFWLLLGKIWVKMAHFKEVIAIFLFHTFILPFS